MTDVLIVENSEELAAAAARALTLEGYSCARVRTLEEARRALQPNAGARVILLDKVAAADEVARFVDEIRTIPGRATIPIVIFSARKEAEAFGRRIGAYAVVAKPADVEHLAGVIRGALLQSGGEPTRD